MTQVNESGPLKFGVFENVALSRCSSFRPLIGGLALPETYPEYCRHWVGKKILDKNDDFNSNEAVFLPCENDKPFIFAGIYINHFGHFTVECIHRLWVLGRPEFEGATVIFATSDRSVKPEPFFYEYLEFLGVKNWKLIYEPTIVEKMVIAEQGLIHLRARHPRYAREVERLYHLNNFFKIERATPKKIAVLRGHLTKGRILGEAALEQYLTKEGYEAFHPEDYPLIEQVATFYNAEKIIISEGSACHLFDIMPPIKAEVAFLSRRPGWMRRPDSTIDKISLEKKVAACFSYKDVSFLLIPPSQRVGAVRTTETAITYASLTGIIVHLKEIGFLRSDAPELDDIDYFRDLSQYVEAAMPLGSEPKQMNNRIVELLATEIHLLTKKLHEVLDDHNRLKKQTLPLRKKLKALKRRLYKKIIGIFSSRKP